MNVDVEPAEAADQCRSLPPLHPKFGTGRQYSASNGSEGHENRFPSQIRLSTLNRHPFPNLSEPNRTPKIFMQSTFSGQIGKETVKF